MPKYKISKGYIKEFFGLFGKKKEDRRNKINQLIDANPKLKAIDLEIQKLNKQAIDKLEDWQIELLRKNGIEVK